MIARMTARLKAWHRRNKEMRRFYEVLPAYTSPAARADLEALLARSNGPDAARLTAALHAQR